MFSLIITIISIALVAALALATLYYGGGAFSKGTAQADAAKILLQGQQLIGASELFQAGENRWPHDMNELLSSKYITSVPHAKAAVQSAIELASAAGTAWTMPKPDSPMFLLSGVSGLDVCGYVNLQGSLKHKGVPRKAYTDLTIQCYGQTAAALNVIIKKSAGTDSLTDAVPLIDGVTGSPPTDPTDPAWLQPPTETTVVTPADPVDNGPPLTQGPPGDLQFIPRILPLGNIPLHGSVDRWTVTLINEGFTPVTIWDKVLDGAGYTMDTTDCEGNTQVWGQLQPLETCNIDITFSPPGAGTHTGTVTVLHDGPGGSAILPMGAVVGAAVPPPPPPTALFVKDTFTDSDGTRLLDHMPEIGLNWVNPYTYETTPAEPCGGLQLINQAVEYPFHTCGLGTTPNLAIAPSADYEVSAEFTLKDDGSSSGIFALAGRVLPPDAGLGYEVGVGDFEYGVYAEVRFYEMDQLGGGAYIFLGERYSGDYGWWNTYSTRTAAQVPLHPGTHTLRLVMVGTRALLYIDTVLIAEKAVSNPTSPGMAGFAFYPVSTAVEY